MLLAWNTLTECVNYLSSNTGRKWNEREVIQASLDFGIFLHAQITTDRDDVPKWMKENEMAELPFNIDLLRFLGGEGLIQIVRYKDNLYKFEPGIKAELENLRISKTALCELLKRFKEKNKNQKSLEPEASSAEVGDIPGSKQSEPQDDAWKETARERANIIYKNQKNIGCDPSKKAIASMIANEFEQEGIITAKGKRLNQENILRHALITWNRPKK
ncbi:MAG: hypothetical protein K2Y09_10465 [Nitrosomonas sp.]|uniref:hypothetical protein n=1 Tax=Nitrosomonas sp. TaxID=42353 RepID=UPI001D6A54F9|nr:hypothetical protein [Nitrosomonas sp.]MBX9895588.1 hypothetical protein [Nitrosomonas sp.]